MIIVYIGLPGSGKSCRAAYHSVKDQKKGIAVYSNFELNKCFLYSVEDLGRYLIVDGNLILDEAGIDVSNRDFMNKKNKSTDATARRFWKKYRHNGIDHIYVFSQAFDFDKTIRNMADKMYIIKNTIIPHLSLIKPLIPVWDVDEDGQPCVKWKIVPFLYIPFWRKPYYKYYNSFERDDLPFKQFPVSFAIYDRRTKKEKTLDCISYVISLYVDMSIRLSDFVTEFFPF